MTNVLKLGIIISMRIIKQLIGLFIALYIVLASQMLFVQSLLANGQSITMPKIKQANASTNVMGVNTSKETPVPTVVPTVTPTPTPTPIGDPQTIEIPKLGVVTVFVPIGVTTDNTMETPKDFSQVGWFTPGSRPGQSGAAIVTGHFDDTSGKPAVFYNLSKLGIGDEIFIKTTLGLTLHYIVESSYSQNYTSFPKELVYSTYEGSGLRLITCDGVWSTTNKTYSKRLVVNARIVNN